PVCSRGVEPIAPDDTYGTLAARLEQLGADLLLRALDAGPAGWAWEEQPEEGLEYAEKIGPEDRTLDAAASAVEQERAVRALTPHIGARMRLEEGSFLGVRRARVGEDGTLELLEVQPPGGRWMPYADYARGRGG
ncbi:MAG: methionyl-tRNA formyltransferase, partial [Actinomycetota bacterium]|nr:methionyl-tRNA formyltransferase [Actinomycetota bacterium]